MNQLTVLSEADIEKIALKTAEAGARIALEHFTSSYFPSKVESETQLTAANLAEYLGCAKSTVLKYKRDGVIPFYQAGRSFYFKKSEVDLALSSAPKKNKKS